MKVELRGGGEAADELAQLRERVLDALLTWVAVGATLSMVLMLVQSSRVGPIPTTMLLSTGLIAAVLIIGLSRRFLPFDGAKLFVSLLGFASVGLQALCGRPSPGSALCLAVLVLSGALFFGRRGVFYTSLAVVFSLLVASTAVLRDWVTPWDSGLWDPHDPLVWLRHTLSVLCVLTGLGTAFGYLIDSLVSSKDALRETLERERAERSHRELAQQALERARRLEALAQFAGGMAHDFNNNLAMIMGKAQMVVRDPRTPRQVAKLGSDIVQSAETAAETVRHLLALGRESTTQVQNVELAGVLRRSLPVLRQVLAPGAEVRLTGVRELHVATDIARLQQTLLNLALNARDAMAGRSDGTFGIEVREQNVVNVPRGWVAAPGNFVVLACSDTGCGIAPEIRQRIFEPFFTTKGPSQGTGLGLATVQRLIHDSAGFIEVDSTVGVGTTFRLFLPVLLPLHSEHADQPVAPASEPKPVRDEPAPHPALALGSPSPS